VSSNAWEEVGVDFVASPGGRLRLHLHHDGGAGTLYWDEVRVVDGLDLENGSVAPWQGYGSTEPFLAGPGRTGAYALALSSNGSVTGAYKDIVGLLPGHAYRLLAWVRSTSGATAKALLWGHDTTGASPGLSVLRTPSSTFWEEISADFVATSNGRVRVHLHHDGGAGTLFWDEVRVVDGSDFEAGSLVPWQGYNGMSLALAAPGSSGGFALAEPTTGTAGGAYRDVEGLVPGHFYNVNARVRSAPGTVANALVWAHDTTGVGNAFSAVRTPTSGSWEDFSAGFLATSNGKLRIHLHHSGGGGSLYWDEIRATDGWDFEGRSLSPWLGYGAVSASLSSVAAGGAQSLAASGSGGMYQDLSGLEAGRVYRVSARVRSGSGTSAKALLWVHDTTGASSALSAWQTPSSTGWEDRTADFVASGNGRLRIHLHSDGGPGTLYWDDIKVARK